MIRLPILAAAFALASCAGAQAQQRAPYEKLVAIHAKANGVPEALVHRVIVRESKYQPALVGHGGTIGLMQIKLATARGLGYTGDADGLRDPETNLTYGVKYLAGAYRAAEHDHDRAVRYFASGYYYVAKRQRLERGRASGPVLASAPQKDTEPTDKDVAPPEQAVSEADAAAPAPEAAAKPEEAAKPDEPASSPKTSNSKTAAKHAPRKKLAEARSQVPRPPLDLTPRVHTAKPR